MFQSIYPLLVIGSVAVGLLFPNHAQARGRCFGRCAGGPVCCSPVYCNVVNGGCGVGVSPCYQLVWDGIGWRWMMIQPQYSQGSDGYGYGGGSSELERLLNALESRLREDLDKIKEDTKQIEEIRKKLGLQNPQPKK